MTENWYPNYGVYWNNNGSLSENASSAFYYNSRRAWFMRFLDITNRLGVANKKVIRVSNATLYLYHDDNDYANSANMTIGYNYSENYNNRNSLYASRSISMRTSSGWDAFDITNIVNTFLNDNVNNNNLILWANGYGGSSSDSRFRGYAPAAAYTSQRPYLALTYELSNAYVYDNGEWKVAIPYVYTNGEWVATLSRIYKNGDWA